MKSQERRDAEALAIFTGLLLFLLVTTAGAVALAVVHQVAAIKDNLLHVLGYCVVGGAAIVSIRYIHRNQGR